MGLLEACVSNRVRFSIGPVSCLSHLAGLNYFFFRRFESALKLACGLSCKAFSTARITKSFNVIPLRAA